MSPSPSSGRTDGGYDRTSSYDAGGGGEASAPLGIQIICVLRGLVDVLLLFAGVALFGAEAAGPVLGTLFVGVAVLDLYLVYGLWTVRYWGWKWALVLGVLTLPLNLAYGASGVLSMIVSALVLLYIYSKGDLYRRARR
jgi:hypothetical protein